MENRGRLKEWKYPVPSRSVIEMEAGLTSWKYSLCSCCDNGTDSGCCDCMGKAFCCTCQYAKAMELAFNDQACHTCCLFYVFCFSHCATCCKRGQLRKKYQIIHGPGTTACADFLVCTFCPVQHYLQMMHEIEYRESRFIYCCGLKDIPYDFKSHADAVETTRHPSTATTYVTSNTNIEMSRSY